MDSRYNPRMSVVENIKLPPTLLSRFDLIYLVSGAYLPVAVDACWLGVGLDILTFTYLLTYLHKKIPPSLPPPKKKIT